MSKKALALTRLFLDEALPDTRDDRDGITSCNVILAGGKNGPDAFPSSASSYVTAEDGKDAEV